MKMVNIPWHSGRNMRLPEGSLIAVSVDGRVVLGRARDDGWSETATSNIMAWGRSVAGWAE